MDKIKEPHVFRTSVDIDLIILKQNNVLIYHLENQ